TGPAEAARPRCPLAPVAAPPPGTIPLVPPARTPGAQLRPGQLAIGRCRTRLGHLGLLAPLQPHRTHAHHDLDGRYRMLEGFQDETAEVNGVRLHYVIGGEGDPMVLCPGWPRTVWQFHKIMPKLAENFRVIAVDL